MWAQIIKARMNPAAEQDLADVREQMMERIHRRPGLVSGLWAQNQNDPQEYYTVIVFESEEQARIGERELEQDPMVQRIRSLGFQGTPEFVNLNVLDRYP